MSNEFMILKAFRDSIAEDRQALLQAVSARTHLDPATLARTKPAFTKATTMLVQNHGMDKHEAAQLLPEVLKR